MADPIREALGRLQQYAAAHPEHDTAELVAAALAARALERPAPVPSLPLPARPSMPLLAPLNGWAACVDGNLVAVYSDRDGTPGHLLWSAGGGMKQQGQARDAALATLAAERPAPDPRAALAARPLLEAVARLGDRIGQHTVGEIATISDRAAAWLAENPPGQPVAIEPRGCPTPGACSCVDPPAPATAAYAARLRQCPTHGQLPANAWGCPECLRELREELARLRASAADDEREELAQWLEDEAVYYEGLSTEASAKATRAAALLRQLPPEGLSAEEYYHIDSGARIVREPCDEGPGGCWTVRNSRHVSPCTEFRTVADALAALQQARRQEVGDA